VTADGTVKEEGMAVSARRDSDEFTLSSDNLVALSPVKVGMLTFLGSEAAFFGTLIMTYVYFLRQTIHGEPNPSQVFRLPTVLAASACLFSSSATIYMAEKALRRNSRQTFLGWWGLTISRNLFGSTYFTLVGFHALHVTIGVIVMSLVFGLAWRRQITEQNETGVEVVSWYWHFVDGVWAVVFTLVYVVGR